MRPIICNELKPTVGSFSEFTIKFYLGWWLFCWALSFTWLRL